ncbi:MAG: porin [Candidatus Aminicenantaceae bacterium]
MMSIIFRKKTKSYDKKSPINKMHKSLALLYLLIICLFGVTRISEAEESDEELKIPSDRSLKLGAYTQAGYAHWEEGREGFRIRQARVILKGDILKNIDYKLQIDAVQSPVLLDATIGINLSPYAILSFGQFEIPFSIENLISGSELDTINRSNTVKNLCPGRDIGAKGRDIGATVNGEFSCLVYTLGVFNGSGINKVDTNDQLDVVGRLVFTPFHSLSIGFSHYDGRYSPDLGVPVIKKVRTGIDIFFIKDRTSMKGEYIFARDNQTERSGWYIQGGYYFIQKKLEAIVKQDSFDRNLAFGEDQIVVTTLGINCFFSKKTKVQINYEYRRGGLEKDPKNVILAQIQAGF